MAGALALLGTEHALLVSSHDGLDELSISAPTRVVEVRGSELSSYDVAPADVGLTVAPADEVPGGDPAQNADTARRIFAGENDPTHPIRPARDLAVLNAGAAIYAGGRAGNFADGVAAAREAVDSGAAGTALERFVTATQRLAPGGAGS
jgi:anthranilate phosphoribosyltransferase